MKDFHKQLKQSLNTGFIDHKIPSSEEFRPKLLNNSQTDGKNLLETMLRELSDCDEFWIAAAFVKNSGVATLINTLQELSKKQIKGKILTSDYLYLTEPEALKRLIKLNNIEVRVVTEGAFHAKGYHFRKRERHIYIIGSSNLSDGALTNNKEWNLGVTASSTSEFSKIAQSIFDNEFSEATVVTPEWIASYEELFKYNKINIPKQQSSLPENLKLIKPNQMQNRALSNLMDLRNKGEKKALVISATGTGKTFLAAFDVREFNPKKFLFIVHRENIAKKAMEDFQKVIKTDKTFQFYSGDNQDVSGDYVFTTIQTISREDHLTKFAKNHFNYIVIDETHRAAASSYRKIMGYFEPDFLLGMTATPERTDGIDIFNFYNHRIAYEIRLHEALENELLSPFHYYGVTDLTINGISIDEKSEFIHLTAAERVDRIIEKSKLYSCDNGEVRGLIFCSEKNEARKLSTEFNQRGLKTVALTSEDDELARTKAINDLQSDDKANKIDYIFSVDIFNEGVDIPCVNQIIMLRPTQSSIIFVQQLGRGLRKAPGKDYLTVIDFIGNYNNNFLVPIALFGTPSGGKEGLRILVSRCRSIPGSSTINFDEISKKRILKSIESANLRRKIDLINSYSELKARLGRVPLLVDFLEQKSIDPFTFIDYAKSYYNFLKLCEKDYTFTLNPKEERLLELFAMEINNAKRIEETILLQLMFDFEDLNVEKFKEIVFEKYRIEITTRTINSCVNNINFDFISKNGDEKVISDEFGFRIIHLRDGFFEFDEEFKRIKSSEQFQIFFKDSIDCARLIYDTRLNYDLFRDGFQIRQMYSRKDVFRILNWERNPNPQTITSIQPKNNCYVIFADINPDTAEYENRLLSRTEFQCMTRGPLYLSSPKIRKIIEETSMRILLFVHKSRNIKGEEFFYLGDVEPLISRFEESKKKSEKKDTPVVKMVFRLKDPVEENFYEYLCCND